MRANPADRLKARNDTKRERDSERKAKKRDRHTGKQRPNDRGGNEWSVADGSSRGAEPLSGLRVRCFFGPDGLISAPSK